MEHAEELLAPTRTAEVVFCGEVRTLDPGHDLLFGRGADLDVDDNPRLHRNLGLIEHVDGWWWLSNVGRAIPIQVFDLGSGGTTVLPPGTRCVLGSPDVLVVFEAGATRYEIAVRQPDLPTTELPDLSAASVTATLTHDDLPLNEEQRTLLVALCESRLLDPTGPLVLPTNTSVAARLGWTTTKFNRKLDYLCDRCARHGVAGLRRDGGRATDRRRLLAEWALVNQVVTAEDLRLLP